MKVETKLVHENGQYIHYGDPFYEGDQLVGRVRGFHDDGGPIQMVNVEKPHGGTEQFYIGRVADWDTRPAATEPTPSAPPPDEVCSSPEAVVLGQYDSIQREIEGYLLDAAQLPQPVHELVSFALQPAAGSEVRRAANAALQELVRSRQQELGEIPF